MPTGHVAKKKANVRKKGPARRISKPTKRRAYRDGYAYDAQRDRMLKVRVPVGVAMPVPFTPWTEFFKSTRPFMTGDAEEARNVRKLKSRAPDYYYKQ